MSLKMFYLSNSKIYFHHLSKRSIIILKQHVFIDRYCAKKRIEEYFQILHTIENPKETKQLVSITTVFRRLKVEDKRHKIG